MSILKGPLNLYLRAVERRYLENVTDPDRVRANLERKSKLLFHAPRGVKRTSVTLGQRPTLQITQSENGPTVLYFHGGAYVFGSPRTHAALVATLCKYAGARAFVQDYRKAPEDTYPSAVDDAEAAWLDLIAQGVDPRRIVIGGDSAGGGLALALLAVILQKGHAKPAGVFAFSPLTDLTFSGSSMHENAAIDAMLPSDRVEEMAALYLGDAPRDDPFASPLFADFTGAPPVYLTVGDTEILRDDSVRLEKALKDVDVDVTYVLENNLPHVWPIFHNTLPEARHTLKHVAQWIKRQTQLTAES